MILDDRTGFVVIAQTHSRFLKIYRVPAVIRKVITMLEMQDRAFRELIATAIPERFHDSESRSLA